MSNTQQDIPEGFSEVVNPTTSGNPSGSAGSSSSGPGVPEGFTEVVPPEQQQGESVGEHLSNIGTNFLHGGAQTLLGVNSLARHIPGVESAETAVGLTPDKLNDWQQTADTGVGTTADKFIGYGGETLLEFLMGDEVLKGLSWADRVTQAAKAAKMLEGSPRLLQAVKAGATLMKTGRGFDEATLKLLGPAERDILQRSPVLSRLVTAGVDAIRGAAVQGAQTLAKSGGDLVQSGKDALSMGVTSGVVGGVTGVIGGMVTKAGEDAKKVSDLAGKAESSSSKEDVVNTLKAKIEQSKNALHQTYENGINDLKDRLGGAEVSAQNNPLADKAQELLAKPDPEEHPMVTQAKEAAGDRLDKKVRELLQAAATGELPDKAATEEAKNAPTLLDQYGKEIATDTEPKTKPAPPWTIDDLIQFRQTVRKLADSYEPGDVNARALRRLLYDSYDKSSALDDTIEHLAHASGDDTAVADYQALRGKYREKINLFDDPVITKIREGKVDDAAKAFVGLNRADSALPSAGKVRYNTEVLKGILGPKGMDEFGQQVFGTMLKDSLDKGGRFNPAKFVTSWNRITDETKLDLFNVKSAKNGLAQLAKDAQSGANLQHLTRAGVLTGVGGAIGGHYGALGLSLGSLLGLVVSEGGGIARGRELLDYIANHPAVWKSYEGLGNFANSGTASKLATGAKAVVSKTASDSSLHNVLSNADGLR